MFGANRALGNWRLAVVCAAAHIIDIGPSYVVVSAIVAGVMYGSWLARVLGGCDRG
jgi:hypothetical protein